MGGIHKSCSFFGHRNADLNENQIDNLKKVIEDLILSHNVSNFLFGSNSDFISLCHNLVTEFKEKYSFIIRKFYNCTHELCVFEKDRERYERAYLNVLNKEVHLKVMDEEVEFSKKYTAGRLSYVERNEAIINDSDYCIFYYDKTYIPKSNKKYASKTSGTKLAYDYAIKKKKTIINVFEL